MSQASPDRNLTQAQLHDAEVLRGAGGETPKAPDSKMPSDKQIELSQLGVTLLPARSAGETDGVVVADVAANSDAALKGIKPGDVIAVRERSRNMALVLESLQSPERDVPDYYEVDSKGMEVKFIRAPELSDVPFAVKMEPNLVVEYYSS